MQTDQGKNFAVNLIHEMCRLLGIDKTHIPRVTCNQKGRRRDTTQNWPVFFLSVVPKLNFLYNATTNPISGLRIRRLVCCTYKYASIQLACSTQNRTTNNFLRIDLKAVRVKS